jgi:hypothetical protein
MTANINAYKAAIRNTKSLTTYLNRENPGEYLNQVYGFLHPGFQLEKFAKTVDACVNAAKESSFFKEWLRRPKDRQYEIF